MGEIPQCAVHACKVVERGAPSIQGFVEHVFDVSDEFDKSLRRLAVGFDQSFGFPARGNACPMQGFADVDVTDANNRFLVKQCEFDGGSTPLEFFGKIHGAPRVKGLGTQDGQQRLYRFFRAIKQVDDAKTTRVRVDCAYRP